MKKVILSLVVVAALSTASCKKNYNCVCTVTGNGVSASTTTVIDNTKSKATTACNALVTNVAGSGYTETCAIQ